MIPKMNKLIFAEVELPPPEFTENKFTFKYEKTVILDIKKTRRQRFLFYTLPTCFILLIFFSVNLLNWKNGDVEASDPFIAGIILIFFACLLLLHNHFLQKIESVTFEHLEDIITFDNKNICLTSASGHKICFPNERLNISFKYFTVYYAIFTVWSSVGINKSPIVFTSYINNCQLLISLIKPELLINE
jgi:hypothetical protein